MSRATRTLRAQLHLSCRQWTRIKAHISTILHPTSRGLHSAGEHWTAWFHNLVLELAIPLLLYSDSFQEWVREACRREALRLHSQSGIKHQEGIRRGVVAVRPARAAPRPFFDRVRDARGTVIRVKPESNSIASNTAGLLHESKFQLPHDTFQPPHDVVKSELDSDLAWNGMLPHIRDMPLHVKSESEAPGFGPVPGHNRAHGGGSNSKVVKSGGELICPQRVFPGVATREPAGRVEERGWET
ncbi:hypothetical protein Q9L58_001964 [Maublancomyces gigas]|uniref:Uncharacterized protein n=1 Tax=Discina gigas TaxID=1032678 RepID=A0ABR3GT38_9PEZI